MFKAELVLPKLTEALGTQNEQRYTKDIKLSAISYGIEEIIKAIKPESMYEADTTLVFIDKKAFYPENFYCWVKLFTGSGELKRIGVNEFDNANSNCWTEKKDTDGINKIFIKKDISSATFRWIKTPEKLTSFSDNINLHHCFVSPLATFAAFKILSDDRKFKEADVKSREALTQLNNAQAFYRNQILHPDHNYISNVNDDQDLFSYFN